MRIHLYSGVLMYAPRLLHKHRQTGIPACLFTRGVFCAPFPIMFWYLPTRASVQTAIDYILLILFVKDALTVFFLLVLANIRRSLFVGG